jgi:hypothetical protein
LAFYLALAVGKGLLLAIRCRTRRRGAAQ